MSHLSASCCIYFFNYRHACRQKVQLWSEKAPFTKVICRRRKKSSTSVFSCVNTDFLISPMFQLLWCIVKKWRELEEWQEAQESKVCYISVFQNLSIMSCKESLKADLVMLCILYVYVLLCSKFLHFCAKLIWTFEQ